jgi:glycosyltransferase involved in cell wall biosynthesis
MKIALVGPGLMEIPPKNWGAVESLIWDYSEYLKEKNIEVDIINNSDLNLVANHLNITHYDFIHVQYDDHAGPLSKLLNKPFCSTAHYGYIKEHHSNYGGWDYIYRGFLQSPGIISLSPEITALIKKSGYSGFIRTLRNGSRTKDFKFSSNPTKDAVCLGKIETRKRQSDLSNVCENKCIIDFIGPLADHTFKENNTCKYVGVWTKEDLYTNLTNYKCLILLSNGEAAPLAVTEALAAGLSIVVSETAAGNLDRNLPFIYVIPNGSLNESVISVIQKAIGDNNKYRADIRKYAVDHFDWSVICDEYLDIVREFINENSISNDSN